MFNIDISLDHIIFPKSSNKRENLFEQKENIMKQMISDALKL